MNRLHSFPTLEVFQFPCLTDNYGFLIHDRDSGACAAIDTPDEKAINQALATQNWQLTHILNTHWHPDHTGGNQALKEQWQCQVIGPAAEEERIPALDHAVHDQSTIYLGKTQARVITTPGHTSGHCVYYFSENGLAFVGDTLFALGCGRLFEGTAEQMWTSLKKIRALPSTTTLFCAHEYTSANADFAITADPENQALITRCENIKTLRTQNIPTVPTELSVELETNPFLRADAPALKRKMGLANADPIEVFAEIRRRKDNF